MKSHLKKDHSIDQNINLDFEESIDEYSKDKE